MKTEKSLRTRAMDIVARQEISRSELKRKLARYSEDENEIETVLDEFARNRWQSDTRYTEAYIHSKSRQHGSLRLKHALAEKGIDSDTIEKYLPQPEEEFATACDILRKKFRQPAATPADKQKQLRFLIYRGFQTDTAYRAISSAWDLQTDDTIEH